jgi:hypothetical protein
VRESLAERLLARVMGWEDADVARERPALQAFADYKYDEYEQYQPGRRFIESLARWLDQFPATERAAAYRFVRERLVFVSRAEMDYLVGAVYPDIVRPLLLGRAADDLGLPAHRCRRVAGDPAFKLRSRSCLYVGLSDGARTAVLRRSTPVIGNEQVVAEYSGLSEKADGLLDDLRADLREQGLPGAAQARFTTLVLLDDFSASGISYIRPDEPGKGKIAKLATILQGLSGLFDHDDLVVLVMLYIATERALADLRPRVKQFESSVGGSWDVRAVQRLPERMAIPRGEDPELHSLIDHAYSDEIYDKHMAKGGADGRYGFADCGLPLILSHNTPNNSLALLWADTSRAEALFPRVSRHREER